MIRLGFRLFRAPRSECLINRNKARKNAHSPPFPEPCCDCCLIVGQQQVLVCKCPKAPEEHHPMTSTIGIIPKSSWRRTRQWMTSFPVKSSNRARNVIDPGLLMPDCPQPSGQAFHRIAGGGLYMPVGMAQHLVVLHPHRTPPANGILKAPPPRRIAIQSQNHSLVHVERPAVMAGQPRLVRRIGRVMSKPVKSPSPCRLGLETGESMAFQTDPNRRHAKSRHGTSVQAEARQRSACTGAVFRAERS